ncbi:MAG TPA: GNAT family N-acetyltransferase [Devosia sp.]|nr:GNAT family N-acetyltransferase [Devosia sp.]
MTDISVRRATLADAETMSIILIRSITELCGDDHHRDAATIAGWTANKTPAGVAGMLANPEMTIFVAERADFIAGVGAIDRAGRIRLNYVSPDHRFAGVSKALLAAMEAELCERGIDIARLESTTTAHRFYRAAGWVDAGTPDRSGAVIGYPMQKRL